MRRFGSCGSKFVAASVLFASAMGASVAKAEVVLYDNNNWRFFTAGRAEGHYQLIVGDGDPISSNRLVGGQIKNNGSQDENNKLFDSRMRSGFVATQFTLGAANKFAENYEAKGVVNVWVNGIDNAKGLVNSTGVDVRDAYGSITGPFGTFIFGRAFSIFGSASGEVNMYAYEFGVGHPCSADGQGIGCGSVGAGPIYAGYNAQLRYHTPRFGGFELQVAAEDPSSLPDYQITRIPRFEGEINYLAQFLGDGKFVVKGQGWTQELGKLNADRSGTVTTTGWGAMGVARLEVAGFKVGGGAWTGKGAGTHNILQQDDRAKPLAHDLPGGGFPGDELRSFRAVFGNIVYGYRGTSIAVGGGGAFVQQTNSDANTPNASLVQQNVEYHAVLTQRIASVALSVEYMHWKTDWYLGETQSLNFIGAGATFIW